MNCNNKKNEFPILHNGTSQGERLPFALNPDYVKVDERENEEWIVFARAYSKFIQFYNPNNQLDGDWRPFWTRNPAIILANISAAKVDWFREETRLITIEIQKLENDANEDLLKQNFSKLFDGVANLALQLDIHIEKLPPQLPVKVSLKNLIQKKLAPALNKWIAWFKTANVPGPAPFPLIDNADNWLLERVKNMKILGEDLQTAEDVWTNNAFSDDWIMDPSALDWNDYVTNLITPDNAIFNGTTVGENINFAIGHAFFKNTFETFLQGFSKAIQEARIALKQLLADYNKHEPHFALFLAFIRLLKTERNYLNGFTDRHLRFYYEDVLHLQPKAPVASRAHLFFELAKHVDSHLLAKGTLFKAGKDSLGNDIFFSLDEDFVANKAKISDLKAILKLPNDPKLYKSSPDQPEFKAIDKNRYYAAPAANKADGLEKELVTTNKEWHPFGNKVLDTTNTFWEVSIPLAQIGFAIASNYLYLTEGDRTITLTFNGVNGGNLNGKTFKIELTAEKGWYEVEVTTAGNQLVIDLAGDATPILPYQRKIHEGLFSTDFPILKATLINDPAIKYEYQNELKNLKFTSVSIHVDVQNKQAVALSGSTGPLDNSKPFHPFGSAPEHGSVFYLGDKEVFQKASNVTLNMVWKETDEFGDFFDPHTHGYHPQTKFFQLGAGKWEEDNFAENIINHNANSVDFQFSLGGNQIIPPDFSNNEPFRNRKTAGYIKFELKGDWGHADYPMAIVDYVLNNNEPKRLYDPKILSLNLNYDAVTTVPLNSQPNYLNQSGRFFHLYPFGFEEVTPSSSATPLMPFIVPQYSTPVNNIDKDGGEWYIGVENLAPPQNLSVLIQVLEGSANPLLEKPGPHIEWAYLKNNRWEPFNESEVSDSTNALLESGIVTFSVPEGATNDNTILPSGMHWIRASVQSAVDAVCQIIDVHAQAALVTLVNEDHQLQIETLPFPPASVQKLLVPQSAVKKVNQPYSSFDGKPPESPTSYYTRASERLRHKSRAITLWDYERMVLEHFAFTHKVKCLNHLQFQPDGNQFIYRELAPGHVTLIVIPNSQIQSTINPLRPYTSLGNLKKIETYLKDFLSCFVTLHVRNPLFEEILAVFKVRFFEGLDESFYEKLLNQEIIQFLSPWAFSNDMEIGFGGKIYKSEIINFIEERNYVDYLLDFELKHLTNPPKPDQEVIQPSTLVSILVSAPEHDITVIKDEDENEQGENCRCGEESNAKF